jgi:hypothetical protein
LTADFHDISDVLVHTLNGGLFILPLWGADIRGSHGQLIADCLRIRDFCADIDQGQRQDKPS